MFLLFTYKLFKITTLLRAALPFLPVGRHGRDRGRGKLLKKNKRYKLSFVFMTMVLSVAPSQSQTTYNHRLDFDRPVPTVLTSIEVTDSCFYVCGITNDTLPPFQVGSLFAKMSFEGEILWYKALTNSYKYIGTINNTLTKSNENFLVSGNYSDTTSSGALLIKYTSFGDTLFMKHYKNPYFPVEGFVVNNDLVLAEEGYIYLLNNIQTPSAHSQSYLLCLDDSGEKIWAENYGSIEYSESGNSISLMEDQFILGGVLTNLNFVSQDYIARTQLMAIDSQGNVQWEYLSPEGELWNYAFDVLPTDDGGYLVASGRGVEVGQLPGTFLQWHSYIFKLDSDRIFEWGVDIRDSFPQSSNQLTKLIEVSDNSGYVAAGRIYQNPPGDGWDFFGTITKISTEGDSLWMRYYNHVDSPADDHIFYDVEETPDGGFVMVGQATDFQTSGELPLQRAWIVKVDEYGCLVPDCHLVSTEEPEGAPFQLKLYPNPATDYLNVYFYHPALRGEAQFELIDASGKVVLHFESQHGDVTHMVPVGHLAAGVYWLRCWVGSYQISKQVMLINQ